MCTARMEPGGLRRPAHRDLVCGSSGGEAAPRCVQVNRGGLLGGSGAAELDHAEAGSWDGMLHAGARSQDGSSVAVQVLTPRADHTEPPETDRTGTAGLCGAVCSLGRQDPFSIGLPKVEDY